MNPAKSLYDNSSQSFKRRNRHLVSGLSGQEPEQDSRKSLVEGEAREGQRPDGPVYRVQIISLRSGTLDDDNLVGGSKPIRDAVAAFLGLDDNQRFITWEYGQMKSANLGTIVVIQKL